MHKAAKKTNNYQTTELCVYAVMPFADCYCRKITGNSIPKIAKYCMEGNNDCPVFDKIAAEKVNRKGLGVSEFSE